MATLDEILARSYAFVAETDPDTGGWVVMFPDLPGCMTQTETLEAVGPMAADAFRGWVTATYEAGQHIPLPGDSGYSLFDHWDWETGRRPRTPDMPSLTSREVAGRLGITSRRVTALAKSRNVGVRRGRDWLFSENEVAALEDRQPGRPPATENNAARWQQKVSAD